MEFTFKELTFKIIDDGIYLVNYGGALFMADEKTNLYNIAEVQLAGKLKGASNKLFNSSDGKAKYVSHSICDNTLTVVQQTDSVEITTVFVGYNDTTAIRAYTSVKNITEEDIVLEEVTALNITGIGREGNNGANELDFYRFFQSHHVECQPQKYSFRELGLYKVKEHGMKKISFANKGSWSTKEELPQGIITDNLSGKSLMFQIESNNSWFYEISDKWYRYYLALGSASLPYCGWSKILKPQGTYTTVSVAIAVSDSVNGVIAEMSKYRRHIKGVNTPDENMPTIFNEYMHLSWDSPLEERTRELAPIVAKTGVEYYVIDCGWHNEEPGNIIYPFVGQWKESKTRFPSGIRKTTDYIRSLGMKAGLWIEPEIVGYKCTEMLEYYDDDCFIQRNGKKICAQNRYFLDLRNQKVIDTLNETIRRMVEDYGADYIKLDYNQDCSTGTDLNSDSLGEGLEQVSVAYFKWIEGIKKRFPSVLFETCSSGGMRMDYKTLSHFSIISTSDQIHYQKYPCIAGNILSAVLPEQAAVWSYPVVVTEVVDDEKKWTRENITDEIVVYNMINSLLGRLHLASNLSYLSESGFNLVKEGIAYHHEISEAKKNSVPYFPLGFTDFFQDTVSAGFKNGNKLYLAVWNRGGELVKNIPVKEGIKSARISYPKASDNIISYTENTLTVSFSEAYQAKFIEIVLN